MLIEDAMPKDNRTVCALAWTKNTENNPCKLAKCYAGLLVKKGNLLTSSSWGADLPWEGSLVDPQNVTRMFKKPRKVRKARKDKKIRNASKSISSNDRN